MTLEQLLVLKKKNRLLYKMYDLVSLGVERTFCNVDSWNDKEVRGHASPPPPKKRSLFTDELLKRQSARWGSCAGMLVAERHSNRTRGKSISSSRVVHLSSLRDSLGPTFIRGGALIVQQNVIPIANMPKLRPAFSLLPRETKWQFPLWNDPPAP